MSRAGRSTIVPDFEARVRLRATVFPSEDPLKVAEALRNVTGGIGEEGVLDSGAATLVTDDIRALAYIRDQLRDRHVRAAARRQLLLNSSGRVTSMILNKQAAAAGVIALCGSAEESPLGPIFVTVESDDLAAVIDWLTAYAGG